MVFIFTFGRAGRRIVCCEHVNELPSIQNWTSCLITKSCSTLCDPWIVAHQVPCPWGFSRQEYWSALPGSFQPRGGTQVSLIACRFFTIWATREALTYNEIVINQSVGINQGCYPFLWQVGVLSLFNQRSKMLVLIFALLLVGLPWRPRQ